MFPAAVALPALAVAWEVTGSVGPDAARSGPICAANSVAASGLLNRKVEAAGSRTRERATLIDVAQAAEAHALGLAVMVFEPGADPVRLASLRDLSPDYASIYDVDFSASAKA